jgi:prephenate dehydrogenase
MWRDIALTNRDALLDAMDALAEEHQQLRALIADAKGDALEAFFTRCREMRRAHDDILNPLPRQSERAD